MPKARFARTTVVSEHPREVVADWPRTRNVRIDDEGRPRQRRPTSNRWRSRDLPTSSR